MSALVEAPALITPPTHLIKPPGLTIGEAAYDALDFAGNIGIHLDDWQEMILLESLAVDDQGYFGLDEIDVAISRQNGKNDVLAVRQLYGALVLEELHMIHTAHRTDTVIGHQERLIEIIEASPLLMRHVRQILTGNVIKAIKFRNGAVITFSIRGKKVGRGKPADLVVIDEAQDVSDSAIAAILPTSASRSEGQRWVMGTPPGPDQDGEYFRRIRTNALAGKREAAMWVEWSALPEYDLDDHRGWLASNPAAPHRMSLRSITSERESLSDADFARERLGRWDVIKTASPFGTDVMELAFDADSRTDATGKGLTFGIDAAPNRSGAAIAVAGRRDDENIHTELVAHRRGMDWLEAVAVEIGKKNRGCTFVIDKAGPAAFLIDVLIEHDLRVVGTGESDMGTACGVFYDRLHAGIIKHHGDPALTLAADSARKRSISGGKQWALTRATSTSDITPIVAAVLAVFGLTPGAARREVRTRPKKKQPARRLYTFR